MRSEHRLPRAPGLLDSAPGPRPGVVWAQYGLNLVALVVGLFLTLSGNRRALILVALVPLVLFPFSWARIRLDRSLHRRFPGRALRPIVLLGILCDGVMLAQLLSARLPLAPFLLSTPVLMWVGSVWFSAHALLALLYGFQRLLRWLASAGARLAAWRRPLPAPVDGEERLARREFLQRATVLGAVVPFGVSLSGPQISYDFRVERRRVFLPSWPQPLEGLRVVHLSDIHVGGAMDRDRLLRVAQLTNECDPDLVLHTGDFLTHRVGDFDAPLYEALGEIRARFGQWACLGNHDFDDPVRLERLLEQCGVQLLRNRLARISLRGAELEIAGLDYQFERWRWRETYAEIMAPWERTGVPRLLLNHDPTAFRLLPDNSADLVLSGHTHGGHIGVQMSSSRAVTLVGLAGLPDQGLFSRGAMHLFVTRCVGFYGYPMRIGIPPEIAVLELRCANPAREASIRNPPSV